MSTTIEHDVEIESGVPMPPDTHRNGTLGCKVWPFDRLHVGQSFFAAGRRPNTFGGMCAYWGRKLGHTYVARSAVKDGVKGVRVWRTE